MKQQSLSHFISDDHNGEWEENSTQELIQAIPKGISKETSFTNSMVGGSHRAANNYIRRQRMQPHKISQGGIPPDGKRLSSGVIIDVNGREHPF